MGLPKCGLNSEVHFYIKALFATDFNDFNSEGGLKVRLHCACSVSSEEGVGEFGEALGHRSGANDSGRFVGYNPFLEVIGCFTLT